MKKVVVFFCFAFGGIWWSHGEFAVCGRETGRKGGINKTGRNAECRNILTRRCLRCSDAVDTTRRDDTIRHVRHVS
jgi:hypothetical protein